MEEHLLCFIKKNNVKMEIGRSQAKDELKLRPRPSKKVRQQEKREFKQMLEEQKKTSRKWWKFDD